MDTQSAATTPLQRVLAVARAQGLQTPTPLLNQVSQGAPTAANVPAPTGNLTGGLAMPSAAVSTNNATTPPSSQPKPPADEALIITKALIERQKRIGPQASPKPTMGTMM